MRKLLLAVLVFLSLPAHADAVSDALKAGGVALLMRHATAPGTSDPGPYKLDDCSTQRNLSAEGRDEARRIGAHLKKLGLRPGEVLTSQWCRCRETAQLAFGSGRDWTALNSYLRQRDNEEAQKSQILARIATLKPGDKPLVLVTHQLNVTALTGLFPESGEVVLVAPGRADGKPVLRVVGSIKPDAAR